MVSFKLEPEPKFWSEVVIKTTQGEGSFKMQFRHLDRVKLEGWLKKTQEQTGTSQQEIIASEVDAFMEVCIDWDIDGEEFSQEALTRLVKNYVRAGSAIVTSFTQGLMGGMEKN
jgi:hypothetical protein